MSRLFEDLGNKIGHTVNEGRAYINAGMQEANTRNKANVKEAMGNMREMAKTAYERYGPGGANHTNTAAITRMTTQLMRNTARRIMQANRRNNGRVNRCGASPPSSAFTAFQRAKGIRNVKDTAANQIIHGDCIKVMRGMPDASVDLIVTDPPYLVNYRPRDRRSIAHDNDDKWLKPAYAEMHRVLKPDAYAVSFYGWPAAG